MGLTTGEAMASRDPNGRDEYVSTGHLPSPRQVQLAVDEAYRMYRSEDGNSVRGQLAARHSSRTLGLSLFASKAPASGRVSGQVSRAG